MSPMAGSGIIEAGDALVSAIDAACTGPLSDTEMIDAFRDTGTTEDRSRAAQVLMIGELIRRGVFTAVGAAA